MARRSVIPWVLAPEGIPQMYEGFMEMSLW